MSRPFCDSVRSSARNKRDDDDDQCDRDDERDDDTDGGDGIRNYVPSVAGTEPARLVASGTPGQEPEEVIVVAHGGNYTKSDVSGQLGHWHSRGSFRGSLCGGLMIGWLGDTSRQVYGIIHMFT